VTQELAEANRQRGGPGETSLQWSTPEEYCGCVEKTATERLPQFKDDTLVPVSVWKEAFNHCIAAVMKAGFVAHCVTWFDSHADKETRDTLSAEQEKAGCDCATNYAKGRTDDQFWRLMLRSGGLPGDDPTLTSSDPKTLDELVGRCMDNGKL
jgi:hypothetical protein